MQALLLKRKASVLHSQCFEKDCRTRDCIDNATKHQHSQICNSGSGLDVTRREHRLTRLDGAPATMLWAATAGAMHRNIRATSHTRLDSEFDVDASVCCLATNGSDSTDNCHMYSHGQALLLALSRGGTSKAVHKVEAMLT
jgi:hypothetical protein